MSASPSDFGRFGFLRAAAYAPVLSLADPEHNAAIILQTLRKADAEGVRIALFPELCLTGYSIEDLFFSQLLQQRVIHALLRIRDATRESAVIAVVGAPYALTDGRLFNCAFVLADGQIKGAVPKTHLPNFAEFYEQRWFNADECLDAEVKDPQLGNFRVAVQQLFVTAECSFAIEICEDLWAPRPPGIEHALAGAQLILNPSASPEGVAKADYRRDLVRMASAQRLCGYLYAASGANESTKDVVFGGHLLAAENGVLLGESERFSLAATDLIVEFDLQKLIHDRQQNRSFASSRRPTAYHRSHIQCLATTLTGLHRSFATHPFVPSDHQLINARAQDILAIQSTGLARRLKAVSRPGMVLAISGGLDSTLALLVALETLKKTQGNPQDLHLVTMPGPGTSNHTRDTAHLLGKACGLPVREISITAAVTQHLSDIGHPGESHDVTFENAQARERTQIVFDLANQLQAIVVGTGDLSELALGWCTYNADHMANYNVNASVPKTLVKYLVAWYCEHRAGKELSATLQRVLDTPISPELVPGTNNHVAQHTEAIIGPYELHDFTLFHFLRNGFAPSKILALATLAFAPRYSQEDIRRWMRVFFQRFFQHQFKRTTLPAGPKVGSVSLSPRGDWRMPDEASAAAFLADLETQ